MSLLASEELLAEQRADPQHIADEQAEGYDDGSHGHSQDDVDDEVGLVGVEPRADVGQAGQEDEVQEVYVEGACAYVLQHPACWSGCREGLLIVAEEHDDERK